VVSRQWRALQHDRLFATAEAGAEWLKRQIDAVAPSRVDLAQ
jgi:hypothetical protein